MVAWCLTQLASLETIAFAHFGTTGTLDFNYLAMKTLDERYDDLGELQADARFDAIRDTDGYARALARLQARSGTPAR